MKQGEIIATGAVVTIILMFVMGAVGPHSWLMQKWNSTPGQQISQQAPATGTSVVGGPSLSAAKIDQILSLAGSPAAGTGQTFYDDSVKYNIDDADALGFFHHESSFGTAGEAVKTHSIGNIKCTAGYSCIDGFRAYGSWSAGIDDWYKLISGPVYVGGGLNTVAQITQKYAPVSDGGDPPSYTAAVESDVQSWRAAA
jgi:hypothetical protein